MGSALMFAYVFNDAKKSTVHADVVDLSVTRMVQALELTGYVIWLVSNGCKL